MNTDKHSLYKNNISELNEKTFRINGCAMRVLNALGHGFHEKIYENALALEFAADGLNFSQQKSFDIFYQEKNIGTFIPDFVVEDQIIVELKTIDSIGHHEKGQVLNYLRASKLSLGIILNFKFAKMELQRVAL